MSEADSSERPASEIVVADFRQVLIWPVQIVVPDGPAGSSCHADAMPKGGPWTERSRADRVFDSRHHAEFVSFMPDVQRFLYGESATEAADDAPAASPMRVFRRNDIASARVTIAKGGPEIALDVRRVDLYFFYDIDAAILVIEFGAAGLMLSQVQDLLSALGRAYPTTWTTEGEPFESCHRIELCGADGSTIATSDYEAREAYLAFLRDKRAPRVASHWAHLFEPLQMDADDDGIACRLLEHQRIPQLAYIAVDDASSIARADWVRLGLASPPDASGKLPFSGKYLRAFEQRHCYDRFWHPAGDHTSPNLRILCSGQNFVMVGNSTDPRFADPDRGALARFRHQDFLIGLIVHFHHSALLIFRDRLAIAISGLRDYSAPTVRRFKRRIRLTHENFLRFTHRYWFHEVSNETPAQEIFLFWLGHLGSDDLFREVREEVQDMNAYLDSDGLRRQANSVVRLTVVTFFGLIGTVATGVLGMNIFDLTHMSAIGKALAFTLVAIPVAFLTFYTAAKSQRLAEFLEAISDERQTVGQKAASLLKVWRRG